MFHQIHAFKPLRHLNAEDVEGAELLKQRVLAELSSGAQIEADIKKHTETSEAFASIINRGYKTYQGSSDIKEILKIPKAKLKEALGYLANMIELPEDKKSDFINDLSTVDFLPEAAWSDFEFAFSDGATGLTKFVKLFINNPGNGATRDLNPDNDRINIISVDVEGDFQLSPKIVYTKKYEQGFLGLTSSSQTIAQVIPQGLSQDEVKLLITSLKIDAMDNFAKAMGYK